MATGRVDDNYASVVAAHKQAGAGAGHTPFKSIRAQVEHLGLLEK